MIRVLVADDHAVVREGLAKLLSADGGIQVAAMAGTGAEALERARDTPVDVVILDMSLPGMNGIETLKQLKIEHKDLAVLMFSMHPEEQYAVRCVKAGAAGYLNKACSKAVLLEAVRRAAGGSQYITPTVGECLSQEVLRPGADGELHRSLSDREFEVFRYIAQGVPPGDVAKRLGLSPKTVSTYRARILEKTGLAGNAEIMRYAMDRGLVGVDP
jgi:two-component system, NarL family, invasion response regulator UvrY